VLLNLFIQDFAQFTDKASSFIDVSVNGSDFDKCSAKLFLVIFIMEGDHHAYARKPD